MPTDHRSCGSLPLGRGLTLAAVQHTWIIRYRYIITHLGWPFSCLLLGGGTGSQTSAEKDSKQESCSGKPQEEEGVCRRAGEQVGKKEHGENVGSRTFLRGRHRQYFDVHVIFQGLEIHSPESGATEQSTASRGTESVSNHSWPLIF